MSPADIYVVVDSAFAFEVTALIVKLAMFLFVLLLAISVHEAAHAWVSQVFGDNTAYLLGRVTLNPKKHTVLVGSLILPITGFIVGSMATGAPIIGWGKPTPINPNKWTNYRLGKFCVSIAGIVANLLVVIVGIVIAKFLIRGNIAAEEFLILSMPVLYATTDEMWNGLLVLFTGMLMWVNLSLAVFNLLPIPPLDGGNILSGLLPKSFEPFFDFVGRFGLILILLALFSVGIYYGAKGDDVPSVTGLLRYLLTTNLI